MKKAIFIVSVLLGIFIIYSVTKDKKIYYLSLGDQLLFDNPNNSYVNYVNEYLINSKKLEKTVTEYDNPNMRTIDLINMINNNDEVIINNKKNTIQNSLIKTDLITLSIGNNDLLSKFTLYELYTDEQIYNYIESYLVDLDDLLMLVRKYCKEKIIFIGYYNVINDKLLDKYYKYLINQTKKITKKYNIEYIDIYDKFNNIEYRSKHLYPSVEGYTYIGQEIIKIIRK